MVFAYGFGRDQGMWRYVTPTFEAADYRVLAFDHIGAGGSDLSAYDPARYGRRWSQRQPAPLSTS